MGVVTAAFFSILTFALAPSLMLGFAAVTAEVSCFTTAAEEVALTTAGEEEIACILISFKSKCSFEKDCSGSAGSHRINLVLFVDLMGSTLKCIKRNLYYLK